ncbi:MAG: phosphatase, partial [bacterium]
MRGRGARHGSPDRPHTSDEPIRLARPPVRPTGPTRAGLRGRHLRRPAAADPLPSPRRAAV